MKCGCAIPVLAEACEMRTERKSEMPVTSGKLFGKDVSVLRDTGCSAVVVKRSLVPDSKLTGRTVLCVLIDGTARWIPTAIIDFDTNHLSGTAEAVYGPADTRVDCWKRAGCIRRIDHKGKM